MRKWYLSFFSRAVLAVVFVLSMFTSLVNAQTTTLTTLPNPPYNGGNSLGGPSQVTFVLNNTNPFPVNLTGVSNWCTTAEIGAIWQLYFTATALTGTSTDVTIAPWTLVGTSTATAVPATGITPLNFPGLSFTIPAGTQYRFALRNQGPGSTRYSGTGTAIAPNTFSGGGVNLHNGDFQIAGLAVGYSGSGTGLTLSPRYFTGAVTFQPAGPCTNPPTAGTVSSTTLNACLNVPFTLSLSGSTGGTGQTFQWQISPDNVNWTNIVGANTASYTTSQTTTNYYRCIVTCGVSATSNSQAITTAAAVSGTFTINSALPTGGTNFQSFNDAYNYIKCGINAPVVFNVDPASGPYNEQLIMDAVPGASAVNTVTFNGNGRTLSFISTNTNERAVIKLNGADHIKFDRLVLNTLGTTATEYGFGVHLINDADSNAVTNSVINMNTTSTSTNYAGIVMSASNTSATTTGNTLSDGNVFSGNTINGGYYGITCVGSTTAANRDNIMFGNTINDFYFYGIYLVGNFNTLVDSNTVTRPNRTVLSTFNGIYMSSLNVSVDITRNTITNPFGGAPTSTSQFNGIFITGTDALGGLENKVVNNRIYNITGSGISYGIHNSSSDNVLYEHNTILMDGTSGTGITAGFYQTILAAGIRFENNIVLINRTGTGAKYAMYYNTATSDVYSDKNDLFINNNATNAFIGFSGAIARLTLADWRTATGDDANSVSNDPFFENALVGNLRPTNAAIDNLGTPLGVLIDITAAPRSATTPDLGAYEFTPGACVAPPVPGTSVAVPNVVCQNQTFTLSLSGQSIGLGQTYQWQSSTNIAGPYSNIGASVTNPVVTETATTTRYYRAAVTCSGNTAFSTPVLVTVNPALPAGTYTINATLPTGGINYNSFNAAKAALSCGIAGPVVFNVVAATGPYNEQLILESIAGTSAINTITFKGNGNTLAFSSNDGNERAVIKLRTASHITFDSLIINATGAGTFGYGVQLNNNADSNTINNCTLIIPATATLANFAGIVLNNSETFATTTGNSFCDGNTFSNNSISGGYYGITCVGGVTTTTTPVFGNRIVGNTITDFYFYGIYIAGNNGTLIGSNDLSRPTRALVSTCYPIYLTGVSNSVQVSKNRIHDPFAAALTNTSSFGGIYITAVDAEIGTENVVSNNLIYNIKGGGILYGLYNSGSNNTRYYHNTISMEDASYAGTSAAYGFYQITQADGIDFRNNIVNVSRASSGSKYGIYSGTATSTITSNFNDYFITGTNAYVGYNGVNRVTLSDWQTASGQDAASVAANPFYSNPASGNYAPMSPVVDNIGTPVGITTDILNAPRSITTPDIGAYEFVVPPCTTPPVAGAAVANPNSAICLGTNINLSLLGNSFGSGQIYQWQFATSATGPWSTLGAPKMFPDTTIIASGSFFYRAAVTCSGNTTFSTPAQVVLNPAFLAGTYTINSTLPVSAVNFTSFASAVAALDCGITGSVFFDVAPNTYNEQIRMKSVAGTSPTVRVTFRSANGNPSSVILTNAATVAAVNYTLKLDSASYITYQNMTIQATNATNGRVIEIANTASFDSIVNCRIIAPTSTSTANTSAGIYADLLRGGGHVIKGNTILNGSSGIYFEGTDITNVTNDNLIDSNSVDSSYYYGIYLGFNGRTAVNKNTVNLTMPRNATNYGIYATSSDSAYQFVGNSVNMNGITSTTTYGMYFLGCDASTNNRGKIASNVIMGLNGNTGTLYGMYQTACTNNNTVNNLISINTSGASSFGSYYTGGGGVRFQNNTILNSSTSTSANNAAGYFAQTSGANPSVNIQNNILSHLGGGRAMYVTNLNFIYSDYNTFYTTGPTLIQWNAGNAYATLKAWRDTSFWDLSSIAVQPALISATDLRPDVANPNVWAIHGRGNQIVGNNYDFNNNPRPTTLTTGVPDMGAYEFLPTVPPSVLTAIPATPAPGITQTFMYGTDTVAKITYDATAPVPASISLQRYSGVLPPGLAAGQQSMYYYTDVDVPAQGAYKYSLQHFYVDSWQGFIASQPTIKLGRTNASNAWLVNAASTVDDVQNVIRDSALTYIDRFTGLTDGTVPPPPVISYPIDSSNSGTRFWVAYGHHYSFSTNAQDMVLYLSTQDSANVTVKVNGTSYSRTYSIPANSARVSVPLPKYGLIDARITDEGKFDRGISISSDVPIGAYTHIYDGANSGAGMLLPTGVYGYEYQSLNARQYYPVGGAGSYSWFMVIADRDSTLVEITPTQTTKLGRPANVPFQVYLNRGEVYNVMGTQTGSEGTDLSGSLIKSVQNASGNCYPIAVFSGSSRTAICNTSNGDNMIQQVFPSQAWGTRYLSFATASSTSTTNYNSNIFRVMVKDVTTVVRRDGVVLNPATLILPGKYYEFNTASGTGAGAAVLIESDKPVMVGQYMVSTGANSCVGVTAAGNGDPEMIYISPLEQGIKRAVFYNTNESAITSNHINVVIPTAGLTSLRIDGVNTFTDVFAHPFLLGYSCVRQNLPATPGQHTVVSDSSFTAITYGLGSVESYGYNAGTLVKNLNGVPSFNNTLSTTGNSTYTCAKAPFKLSVSIPLKPTFLLWRVSQVPGLLPNRDTLQNNPVPVDSTFSNGRWFYRFVLNVDYRFSAPGVYNVPIRISHPSIEGCSNTQETTLTINVLPAPQANFTGNFSVCLGQSISFNGSGSTSNGVPISTYNWNFGDATTATGQTPVKTYTAAGTYNVAFSIIAQDGCIGDTTKQVVINPIPTVTLVSDSLVVCGGAPASFVVRNPVAGTQYSWFTQQTGGTAVFTGTTFTVPNVTGTVVYYVQATSAATCVSPRIRLTATLLPDLIAPVVTTDSIGVDRITFRWNAVAGAITYEVSTDGGATWIVPSSGTTGLTHTVTGLLPLTEVTLRVRARGIVSCQQVISQPLTVRTLTDQIYIPNAFTPNGDGKNEVLMVYGYTIQNLRFTVFNQWGEKIFESANQATGWNGNYNGKPQPSGVYMYVCQITYRDGTSEVKKGSVNLVR
jgi:gliding motility-associated-like protein